MKAGNIEVYGIIYKIENLINKKVYIGQTKRGFKKRYKYGGNTLIERVYTYHEKLWNNNDKSCNTHLLRTIRKNGFENFKVIEIFDIAFSKSELDIKEQSWISIYNSFDNGYNNTLGGDGNLGLFGKKNPMAKPIVQLSLNGEYIREWECMENAVKELNIGKGHICSVCSNTYGRKSVGGYIFMYAEDYKKLEDRASVIYINDWGKYNQESVVQLSLTGEYIAEFESMAEASRKVKGTMVSKISKCCKKERKSHYGYMWIYKNDYINKNIPKYDALHDGKPKQIVQLSMSGEYINTFKSAMEASRKTGINNSKISAVCKGRRKSCGGFKWVLLKNYKESLDKIS